MPKLSSNLSSPTLRGDEQEKTLSDWHDIFKQQVQADDPLWKEYVEAATEFDNRMIDEWNKVVDVVLVYVALFTAVLTAFILQAEQEFQPDPNEITNKLLLAIYKNQIYAQQNNSAYIFDADGLFTQNDSDYRNAVVSNSLLFTDLALSVLVSVIALIAKLWLIRYSNRVNSTGSPYERAMRRQEAYSGVLAWKLGAVIDSLPFLLLIAVFLFGFFVYCSIQADQSVIGYVVGTLFILGLVFVVLVSIAAAFIPDCPFHSSLSTLIRQVFDLFPDYPISKRIVGNHLSKMKPGLLWIAAVTVGSIAVFVVTVILILNLSGAFYALFCLPVAGVFSFLGDPKRHDQQPRIYGMPHWFLVASMTIAPLMVVAGYFPDKRTIFIPLYSTASFFVILTGIIGRRMYRRLTNTREADAIVWLLQSTSSQKPSNFTSAARIAGESDHQKALLLTSLLPLLSPLITSYNRHSDSDASRIDNLKVYVACLAQLSGFKDCPKSLWNNEAGEVHPPLPEALRKILEELKGDTSLTLIRDACEEALEHFGVKAEAEAKETV